MFDRLKRLWELSGKTTTAQPGEREEVTFTNNGVLTKATVISYQKSDPIKDLINQTTE